MFAGDTSIIASNKIREKTQKSFLNNTMLQIHQSVKYLSVIFDADLT